jgi:uroporphyrin-III C-methyltransferase
MTGFVSLVGAGPGDPDLLTQKAVRRLEQADLVLYDALVAPEALELAPRAQRFFVGKRARREAIRQETIHGLMIRSARRGKRVVRLKCGDPFLLGRGGEEALALAAAGIPFEVVPGISSAIAAPALAGIPVTHRGLASGFVVVSGHAEAAYRPILGSIEPDCATIVVLMGLASRAAVAALLLGRGWPSETPAAILLAASTPESFTWTGPLEALGAAELPEDGREAPGTLVIGAVVSLAESIAQVPNAVFSPVAAAHGQS